MSDRAPRFLEFFAGAGLVRLALEPEWRCVWANDVSEKKARVYRDNFGGKVLHVGDVAAVRGRDIPDAEMAWASFPCQDLSLAGWRRGMAASRSGAFWGFWSLMSELKEQGRLPAVLVLENVAGLLQGDDFLGLCEALAALGLRTGALTIDARRFVAQSRPRVFVVAAAAGWGPELAGTEPPEPWASDALRRAVGRLPAALADRWTWWRLPEPLGDPAAVESLIDAAEGDWFDQQKVDQLLGMMAEPHRRKVEAVSRRRVPTIGFLYRRVRKGVQRAEVRFDGLAGCLRTPAGGSSRQTVVWIEGDSVRMRLLTAREAARLMGVADGFRLPPNYNDGYRAMGDGVCVPAVAWLARHLLTPLTRDAPRGEIEAEVGAARLLSRTQQRADRWLRDRP